MDDIERLRRLVADTCDPYAADELGHLLWRRRTEADVDEAVQAFALAMTVNVGTVPEELLPCVADAAADYAVGLLQRAIATPDPAVVNLAADLWNRIANVLPHHAGFLSRLGIALRVQFERTGDRQRLDLAVRAGETALLRADESDPEFPSYLCNIGVTLRLVFVHGGDRAELTRSVELLREAVATLPMEHPERADYLCALAMSMRLRAEDRSELDFAVRLARRAATIGGNRADLLSNLAVTLLTSYRDNGERAELDEATDAASAAVAAIAAGRPERSTALTDLAAVLRSRFEASGDPADLREAIRAGGDALRSAVATDPDQALYRTNLALALLTRHEKTGRDHDLDQAVRLLRAAEAGTPPDHSDRPLRLSHLGLAVEAQALATGDRVRLDEAVRFLRAASDAADGHPLGPMFRSNLANVLLTRFDWMGAAADLDEAVENLADAVSATARSHPDRPLFLGNLGSARLARFRRHDDPADADAAVEASREVLRLTPDGHPARPGRLTNLGIALRARSSEKDLDEAVECCETAVLGQADDHPDQGALLSNLSGALVDRYKCKGDPADLADAVRRSRQAVRRTPAGHPAHGIYQSNLGHALTSAGRTAEAADVCLAAAGSATTPVVVRLRAAWHASELLADDAPVRAGDAGRIATRLLPLAVPRALARTDQEAVLSRLAGVASDAAALTLAAPDPVLGEAIEALETGRVVLLGQIRDEHPDLTRLRARRPDLAGRLEALAMLLGSPGAESGR